ncbi:alginate O-acetyltransferase complex protein AlgI [Lachnospiraceae bacterium C7]|nr:alginate O-acetyltransferase complex protein AlgI [Lachnospiraceae bacterium C7]
MVFSSLTFLLYFLPITILGFFLLGFSIKLQNIWLLIVSLIFYAWGEPVYVSLLIISIIVNYIMGLLVDRYNDVNQKKAKIALTIDVVANLSILFVFKYMDFFISSINGAIGKNVIPKAGLTLPIGISFFTFQALSYVVDVYRHDANVQKNPLDLGLYIAFFPQLVAGPIVRYKTIEYYINNRRFNINNVTEGTWRFSIGLVKKILLANNLGVVVDNIYKLTQTGSDMYQVPVVMAWIGAAGYMLQLFFDFSSYSDMAIGLGKIFGFEFDENFNYPFISKSIGEFWRRWHISLGTWFKEYVYFPLGGSRVKNADIMVRNTFVVWALTGLWHGASWTFILWGLYNLLFLLLERIVDFEHRNIPAVIRHAYVVVIFMLGMVMFRAQDIYLMREYFKNMFMANGNPFCSDTSIMILREYWMVFIPAIMCSIPIAPYIRKKVEASKNVPVKFVTKTAWVALLCLGMMISVSSLVRGGYNPFIYFNF